MQINPDKAPVSKSLIELATDGMKSSLQPILDAQIWILNKVGDVLFGRTKSRTHRSTPQTS
ncbi:MAG: hypothetical protein HOO67_07270 [Candidatus Peribacteraceae bacterium]|nr:hypothetical protein [Candidatus Peribacteraceae bacterium]